MSNRPTINDLARAAGVSTATVDRVLNGRASVRPETARRVYEAAQAIGYHAAALIGHRVHSDLPRLTIGFVLSKERHAFSQAFKRAAEQAAIHAPDIRARAIVEFSPTQQPADFARLMEGFAGRVDAVAAVAVNHVEVTTAIERLHAQNIPCFALCNDFGQGTRDSYIGLNNMKIGRMAAHMVTTAARTSGKLAMFVGGHRWHGHELRETGFRSYQREFAPEFTILDTLVNLETRQLTYEATLDLLSRHPDLRGIYCAGGGMEGAIAALREARQPRDVALVVNELTPESRSALADRYVEMVIGTPLDTICRNLFAQAHQARASEGVPLPGQTFLRPDIHMPESI